MQESLNLQCPRCNADAIYSYGHTKNGKQRYLCLLCNRQFVQNHQHRQWRKNRPVCPQCGSPMHIYMRNEKHIRLRCANYPDCRGYQKWQPSKA